MIDSHGLFRGTIVSRCLTPCKVTQTNSILTHLEKRSDSNGIHIEFDNRVLIKKVTLDKFELMESLNFFGSNFGLWPGLGIFQIIEWIIQNIL